MDGLTFIAIMFICGTVCFVTVLVIAYLSDQGSRRHCERMAEIKAKPVKTAAP
jgi:hypothetical protein